MSYLLANGCSFTASNYGSNSPSYHTEKEKNELGVFCLTSSSNNFEFTLSLEYLASLYSLQTIFCFLLML